MIRDVVKQCEPLISLYVPYYYWMNITYFQETCAVAEENGTIVGWLSILSLPQKKYFVHQLGVNPDFRNKGVASALISYLFQKIKDNHDLSSIELTIERDNEPVKKMFGRASTKFNMTFTKKPEEINLLKDEYNEDLYIIKPL